MRTVYSRGNVSYIPENEWDRKLLKCINDGLSVEEAYFKMKEEGETYREFCDKVNTAGFLIRN